MWLRHRSAPAPVWLAAALGLIVFASVAAVMDIFVLRPAREESAFTRGIPRATLADASPARAVYTVVLRSVEDQVSPAGTPAVAYRWRVTHPESRTPLCQGESTRAVATEESARLTVDLPLDERDWGAPKLLPIPRRIAATCTGATNAGTQYQEWIIREGVRADVVGCERLVDGLRELTDCNDSAASRIFLLPSRSVGRARARIALDRIAAAAVGFSLCAVLAGISALKVWRRTIP